MSTATRDRIIDAALALFAREGVSATKLTEIEAGAGLTPGSGGFHRYFRTKDDVLGAAVERELERVRAARAGETPSESAGSDVRVALALEYADSLAGLTEMRALIAILAREHGRIPELARGISDVMIGGSVQANAEQVAARMQAGQIPERDPAALVTVVMCALVGYNLATEYFFGNPPGDIDRTRFIETLVDLVAGETRVTGAGQAGRSDLRAP